MIREVTLVFLMILWYRVSLFDALNMQENNKPPKVQLVTMSLIIDSMFFFNSRRL